MTPYRNQTNDIEVQNARNTFVANLCCVGSFFTFRVFISYIYFFVQVSSVSWHHNHSGDDITNISRPLAGKRRMPMRHYLHASELLGYYEDNSAGDTIDIGDNTT